MEKEIIYPEIQKQEIGKGSLERCSKAQNIMYTASQPRRTRSEYCAINDP